jgi:hypothetical protein
MTLNTFTGTCLILGVGPGMGTLQILRQNPAANILE